MIAADGVASGNGGWPLAAHGLMYWTTGPGRHLSVPFGQSGDIPVQAHYTSGPDGPTDLAVYRPSTQNWYVKGQATVHYGAAGDVPVPGAYTFDASRAVSYTHLTLPTKRIV